MNTEGGPNSGIMGLILVKVFCCGGLLLAMTGAFSGFGGWVLGGGLMWLVLVAAFAVAGTVLWRRGKPGGSRTNVSPRVRGARPQ